MPPSTNGGRGTQAEIKTGGPQLRLRLSGRAAAFWERAGIAGIRAGTANVDAWVALAVAGVLHAADPNKMLRNAMKYYERGEYEREACCEARLDLTDRRQALDTNAKRDDPHVVRNCLVRIRSGVVCSYNA